MNLFSPEAVFALSNYTLLIIIFFTALKYLLLSNKADSKGIQKIIGGLVAFEVALVSNNPVIIFTSLFIGGLIIASEEFMHNLAIIIKSKSEDIGKNLSTKSATPTEVEKKHKQEIKKMQPTSPANKLEYEKKISEYLKLKLEDKFEANVKIISPDATRDTVVDGVIKDELGKTLSIVEIIYIDTAKASQDLIMEANDKIRSVSLLTHLTLIFVSKNKFTKADMEKLLFWNSSVFEVSVGLFEIHKGEVKSVSLPFIPGIDYF